MDLLKRFLLFFLLVFAFLAFAKASLALQFGLIAPAGTLHQGDTVQFIITVNTEGSAITSTSVGLNYQTQYLQYTSTAPGTSMSSVFATNLGNGQLSFTGTNNSGFSGQGDFALVNFKIIAQTPGSTTLCTLVPANSPTASPVPGATNTPTPIPGATDTPTPPPGSTATPVPPTSLPVTGSTNTAPLVNLGFLFLTSYLIFYTFSKK